MFRKFITKLHKKALVMITDVLSDNLSKDAQPAANKIVSVGEIK